MKALGDGRIAHSVGKGLKGLSSVGLPGQAKGNHPRVVADQAELNPQVCGLLDDAEDFQPPSSVRGHEVTTVEGAKNHAAMRGTSGSVGRWGHTPYKCKFIATGPTPAQGRYSG